MHIKTLFSALTSLTLPSFGKANKFALRSTLAMPGLSSVSCCFASQTCLGLGIVQASLASALGFDRFASRTCLGIGIVQASLASALSFDRLSLYSPLRYRKVHRTFLHIARYAPYSPLCLLGASALPYGTAIESHWLSSCTAIYSMKSPKSQESNF